MPEHGAAPLVRAGQVVGIEFNIDEPHNAPGFLRHEAHGWVGIALALRLYIIIIGAIEERHDPAPQPALCICIAIGTNLHRSFLLLRAVR